MWRSRAFAVVACAGCACCGAARAPELVTAPAVPVATSAPATEAGTATSVGPAPARANVAAANGLPAACDKPWNLDVVGGDGRVVVVCAHDVRRRPIDESAAIARALEPGLDPAREKICACVARLKAPPFVDLLFTAQPEEGRVTVQAGGDDDLDPEFGPPFVACIGTVVATFAPVQSDACADPGKVAFIYPVRLELAP